MNWREKLDKFLADFEHTKILSGVLICGSYITGNPTKHSDLDTHLILKPDTNFRERGNRIIDGLIIEYFANPSVQIHKYFDDDFKQQRLMSQTQFATGCIIMDKEGEVAELKKKATRMIEDFYKQDVNEISVLKKYFIWDMSDNLQDAFETNRPDFDFLYFNYLDSLIATYMQFIKRPYNKYTILGNINNSAVKAKYLLKDLPDTEIADLIAECIVTPANSMQEKIRIYQELSQKILDILGGFDIGNFTFKSKLDV